MSNLEERFWAKVEKTDECWTWTGYVARNGYGRLGWHDYAHRTSWELANGPIPTEMVVDHICHNPTCVRPEHLRLASRKQNAEHHAGPRKNNKSGVRGVFWHKDTGKWRPKVMHNGVVYYCGLYADLDEAEAAVIALRNDLHSHNNNDRVEVAA